MTCQSGFTVTKPFALVNSSSTAVSKCVFPSFSDSFSFLTAQLLVTHRTYYIKAPTELEHDNC